MTDSPDAWNFAPVDEDGIPEGFDVVDAPKGRPPMPQVHYMATSPNRDDTYLKSFCVAIPATGSYELSVLSRWSGINPESMRKERLRASLVDRRIGY